MPRLRFWVKILLFISAYTPLFLILIIKYISFYCILFYILIAIITLANIVIFLLFKYAKRYEKKEIKVKEVQDESSNALNYVIAYIIAFLGFRFETWQDWFIFISLIIVIFFVYSNSNLIYVNPILTILGYRIYKIDTFEKDQLIVISKKSKIVKNSVIIIKNISEDAYLEVDLNDRNNKKND